MSGAPGGDDELRDTIVPQDAPGEAPADAGARDTLAPHDAPEPMLRRDPGVRVRHGLALGGGLALVVCAAGLAPLAVVALLLHRDDAAAPAAAATVAPPTVDFLALRAAIPAPPPPTTASTAAAPRAEPDPSLHAFARLANRVYEAREAWRKAGRSGRELFKTASVDELGGAAFTDELALGPRRFVWLRREAKVLAPAGAPVPEGVAMKDAGNDPGPSVFDGTLEGKPVRAIRTCMFGETYCLVDVVDVPVAAPSATVPPEARQPGAGPSAASPADDAARLAAFDAAVKREADKLAAWTTPAPATARRSGGAPLLPLLAGAACALALAGGTVVRLRRLSAAVIGAAARLRAAAAGRLDERKPARPLAAELADLEAAVDEAATAIGDGAARAQQASRRRARLGELAQALTALAAGRLEARAPTAPDDDPALAALTAGANAALESIDARVVRWRSHAAAAATGSQEALRALHTELQAMSTSKSAPALVGALRDLPPGEIARRLPETAP